MLLLQNMLYCRAVRRCSGLCIVTGLNGWEASFVCAQQEDLGNAGKWYFCSSSVRIFRLKIQGQHRLLPAEEDTADRTQLAQGTQPRARVPHRVAGHLAPSGSLPTPPFFFFCSLREVSGQWHKFLLQKETFGLHTKNFQLFGCCLYRNIFQCLSGFL